MVRPEDFRYVSQVVLKVIDGAGVIAKGLVYNFRWTSDEIGSLFLDDSDYRGLYFWLEALKEYTKKRRNGK